MEIARQTGVVAPELQTLPSVPYETRHLWRWFCDISRARTAGWGVDPISWTDAWSYFRMLRIRPQPWEVEAIRALDDAFIFSRQQKTAGTVRQAGDLRRKLSGSAKAAAPEVPQMTYQGTIRG